MRFSFVSVALPAVLLAACQLASDPSLTPNHREVALVEGLDVHHRAVSTRSEQAQRYFDQGLVSCYGFNHEEAISSFREAARLDPNLAMAHWGIAYAFGPHINNPAMDEDAAKAADEALRRARELAAGATPVERALIGALAARYAFPPPEDRAPLDRAYADAMRAVWRDSPEDADVGALYADALMNLRPWDLWKADGTAQPETPEIIATLERVMELEPDHPAALHFYIHTVEASPDPGRALEAANRLRARVPGAGHLVHMPSHIDIRLGRYAEAVAANQRGIAADLAYVARAGRSGFYSVYRAHNYHFLAYAAMFDGQRDVAMKAARDLVSELPVEVVRQMPDFLDPFYAVPVHVMVRFGLWDAILEEPEPPAGLPATMAFWRYARTVAFAALGRVAEAEKELAAFERAAAQVPETALLGNNPVSVVLEIASLMAGGELEYRRGNHDRAFAMLREAVRRDDELRYDEPWGWMQPVRHALGALLLEQGRLAEAAEVYREDLDRHPGNGWALVGLAEALERKGERPESERVRARLGQAWARADVPAEVSCYCRRSQSAT